MSTQRLIRDMLWGALCGAFLIFVLEPRAKPRVRGHHRLTEAQLDEMIEETFPASDPPSY